MDQVIIYKEHISSLDSRLKRSVYHDSRSRNFAFNTSALTIKSAIHERFINILDQGDVGSCTGNAGIGALATNPLHITMSLESKYSLDQTGAVRLYSDAQSLDGKGVYPPNDFGSYGLSIAKVLKSAKIISNYQHTFSLDDALKALTVYPILVGMNWYTGMFTPDTDGRVHLKGSLAGGHEVMAREIDAVNKRVWFDNSWGIDWGKKGRFYLTFADFQTILKRRGDVIVLLPLSTASPSPLSPSPDALLAIAMRAWLTAKSL